MMTAKEVQLEMLRVVAERLEPLLERLVFVGGCAVGLLITDEGAADVRPTQDVDLIAEVLSRADYWQLEEDLRRLGLRQALNETTICRWEVDGTWVDIMPTDEKILGFSNRWYSDAIRNARRVALSEALEIQVVTAPFFLATKIEAFHGRGKGDYFASHDLEDLLAVVDGRPEIVAEVQAAPADLHRFLAGEFTMLLSRGGFREALAGHLPPDQASQARLPIVIDRLERIAEIAD